MSNYLISFLAACGASAWAYAKALRRTGGLKGGAIAVTVLVGVFTFIVMLSILAFTNKLTTN